MWGSGVSIPEIGSGNWGGVLGAPWSTEKYAPAYPLATLVAKPRSIAYLTSAEVTSRFTGGLKWTPCFRVTVTVLPSFETVGMLTARSGSSSVESAFGTRSARWVGRVISYENE